LRTERVDRLGLCFLAILLCTTPSITHGKPSDCKAARIERPRDMGILKVERIGGLAGFGGAKSLLKSDCEIAFSSLSLSDQKTIEALFKAKGNAATSQTRDGFSYRVTRGGGAAGETILVSEHRMPPRLSPV
jgi:hypothetical protein